MALLYLLSGGASAGDFSADTVVDHPEIYNRQSYIDIQAKGSAEAAKALTMSQIQTGDCIVKGGVYGPFEHTEGSMGADAYIYTFHKPYFWNFWDQHTKYHWGYVELHYQIRVMMEQEGADYFVTVALDQGNFSDRGRENPLCAIRSCKPTWQTLILYSVKVSSLNDIDTDAFSRDAEHPQPPLVLPNGSKIQFKCAPGLHNQVVSPE
jgi:hypothetical protein